METIPLWAALLIALGLVLFSIAVGEVQYRLGVNDGYRFRKDPTCPGYQKARRILESYGEPINLDLAVDRRAQAMSGPPDVPAPR